MPPVNWFSDWCAGRDLNPHGIATTSPSNWRVCRSTTRASRDYFGAGVEAPPGTLPAGAGAAGAAFLGACFGITLAGADEKG
jgi:hypothetical protein